MELVGWRNNHESMNAADEFKIDRPSINIGSMVLYEFAHSEFP